MFDLWAGLLSLLATAVSCDWLILPSVRGV